LHKLFRKRSLVDASAQVDVGIKDMPLKIKRKKYPRQDPYKIVMVNSNVTVVSSNEIVVFSKPRIKKATAHKNSC